MLHPIHPREVFHSFIADTRVVEKQQFQRLDVDKMSETRIRDLRSGEISEPLKKYEAATLAHLPKTLQLF